MSAQNPLLLKIFALTEDSVFTHCILSFCRPLSWGLLIWTLISQYFWDRIHCWILPSSLWSLFSCPPHRFQCFPKQTYSCNLRPGMHAPLPIYTHATILKHFMVLCLPISILCLFAHFFCLIHLYLEVPMKFSYTLPEFILNFIQK
jgi:hypothetical protein